MTFTSKTTILPFEWTKTAWTGVITIFVLLWIPALILLLEHNLDNSIQLSFNTARDIGWLAQMFLVYSRYGIFIVFGLIVIIVLISFKNPTLKTQQRIFLVMFISAGLVLVLNLLIKEIVHRDRPFIELGDAINSIYYPSGYSFPSSHSATTFGLVLPLIFFLGKGKMQYFIRGFFLIFAILVAFSRVFLGVHYLSDIMAGTGLGFLVLGIATWIANQLFISGKITQPILEKILKTFAIIGVILAPIIFILE